MKTVKISQMVQRTAFVLVIILGFVFWAQPGLPITNPALKGIHQLLGIIVVISLWVIGLAQGRLKGGSLGIAIGTFIVGLLVLALGLFQDNLKSGGTNSAVETINTIHLLLGLSAIGFGEMIGRRVKRAARAEA